MNKNGSRKRAPPPSQRPPAKLPSMTQEEEFMDEDVFLDETLLSADEESLILRDIEQRQALATRLSKWTRPPLDADYVAQSRSVVFPQLEIDYVIGESHKELLPNSSGPAAVIRIFGVTKEGLLLFLSSFMLQNLVAYTIGDNKHCWVVAF
ncbi:DNA polymerase delta catalytic subunit [Cajanus cajan]|uniref:DNA polymerase delta catalytic subunit n=1 Tax=Cajanus cajan TaxID=3821 RepID=UPI00098DBB8B|nr:DNA polymerase delta catalytic subunit [Cajanus cajan]